MGRSTRSIPKTSQGGTGAPRLGIYQPSPPFIETWEQMRGGGKKKKKNSVIKIGLGLLLGANSPFKNVPLLNPIL